MITLVGDELTARDPRQLGRWVLQSRLGFGGMGVVYLGTDGADEAAVKVVRPGLLDEAHVVERFAREVAVLQSVRDVHISRFMGADLHGEPAWLAIEYIPGPTLKQQVTAHGPLERDKWWELARALAQALAVLDVHRVVHRDLKPGNVIVAPDRPVLIDFGIAHPEDATSLTATGLVTGSPSWLSPEQANSSVIGAPSDVFSLGSLLAYAGTSRPPFGEGVAVAVLVRISSEEPDLEGLGDDQAALVRDLLEKDPAARPTARELLDRLRLHYYETVGSSVRQPGGRHGVAGAAIPAAADVDLREPTPAQTDVTTPQGVPTVAETSRTAEFPVPEVPEPVAAVPDLAPDPTAGENDALALAVTRVLPLRQEPASAPPAPPAQERPVPVASPSPAPRTARPATRNVGRVVKLVAGGVAAVAIAGLGFNLLDSPSEPSGGGESTSTASPIPTNPGSPTPAPTGEAPEAPRSDQLRSGDWLLAQYALHNDTSTMSVTGTLTNTGSSKASADIVVWVYVGDEVLGSVGATVTDVPAGESTKVTLTGDFAWKPGQKILLVQATDRS
ncbi:MAG: serine/threonine protein kinase [Candidatus Nanopelagicales bacterium]